MSSVAIVSVVWSASTSWRRNQGFRTLQGARYSATPLDLKTLAIEADVDAVLTGTLVRHGDRLRITAELVEVPAGTRIWSHGAETHLGDMFRLQDELVHGIVESLSVPLTAREHRRLKHDVPASGLAYELYLRANELYYDWDKMALARDLYLRSVEEDPRYAPAWARLGRCHRLLAKWSDSPGEYMTLAESAFERALSLNPDLPIGHCLYAQLESDLGRPRDAMIRLLRRARMSSSDPDVFAGLTHACRYCGLLEASLASHERAHRLDPQVRTSVAHTHFAMRDYRFS